MKGSLKIKRGYFYAVINYKDNYGKYKQKWFNTGLKERGNKKEAQKILDEKLSTFQPDVFEVQPEPIVKNDIIFIDYIENYVKDKKKNCRQRFMLDIRIVLK